MAAVWEEIWNEIPLVGGGLDAERDARRAREAELAEWDALQRAGMDTQYEEGEQARAGVYADPRDIAAQRDALAAMQDIYQSGGMTAADRARQQIARQRTGQMLRSEREAATQQAQQRGLGGGMPELMAGLSAQQGAATALSMEDAAMLQDAQRRAFAAMQASGGLGGQMRGMGFGEASQRASAIDEANRSNVGWRRDTRMQAATGRTGTQAAERQYREAEAGRKDPVQFAKDVAAGAASAGSGGAVGAPKKNLYRPDEDEA